MHAAQIIPCSLKNFDNKTINGPEIVRDILLFWHRPDGETDFASYLRSKIAIFAN